MTGSAVLRASASYPGLANYLLFPNKVTVFDLLNHLQFPSLDNMQKYSHISKKYHQTPRNITVQRNQNIFKDLFKTLLLCSIP